MSDDKKQLDSIFNEYFSTDRTLSHTKITYSLSGFFNTLSAKANRDEYIIKYFENLPEVLNNQPLQIGKVLVASSPGYICITKQIEYFRKV